MMYQVVNPSTGQVEKEYPTATDAEINDVLDRTARAYTAWRRTPITERADILRKVAQIYKERSAELGAIITREMGKTTAEAQGELAFTRGIYRYYADNGADLLKDEPLQSNTPGSAWVRKSPVGALLGIMPWNYPYYQVARFADAYINVFATNEQVAEMIADPRIAGVSVTGSERAGSAVAAVAGQNLKKVVLELGGSDPFIVLDGADLPSVAKAAAAARMENGGQACNASKRMIVTEDVYDEFVSEFTAAMSGYTTGDPTDPSVAYGPLSSERAAEILMGQIEDAVSKGATVQLGGHRLDRPGAFVEATVLTGVTPEMRAYREELFGPAAVVYKVSSADEAVDLANSSSYGLGGAVFSRDEALALDVADRLDVGMVWINQAEGGGPELPFGGTKRSGVGRELGPLGIDEFVNKKLIHTTPEDE
jgi:succinate-semialdehyde dehydrogenase/glutarate-semialdehyde dehydrogenase